MMSTITGLIVGMLLAALVTVVYGPQLSSSLREAIDNHPTVKALLEQTAVEQPGVEQSGVEQPGLVQQLAEQSGEPGPAASLATKLQKQVPVASAELPQSTLDTANDSAGEGIEQQPGAIPESDAVVREELEQPGLEQRWASYAASAAETKPVGTFPWQRCFQRAAASYEVPLALLLAIASGESNFDPVARSDKDAIGLMQIRWPATSRHLGVRRQADLYDPCTNVDAGARYLRELAERYADNLHLTVAAYNYGPGRVSSEQVPEGALWYSHYIYQHLQQVLGLAPSATSDLIALPEQPGAGREVLMSFTRAHRARDFIAFLSAQVPGLNLQQQSESLGRHEVVLLYQDQTEKRQALQALSVTGLEILGPQSYPSYHL